MLVPPPPSSVHQIFRDYEVYVATMHSYRQREWVCSITGRGGLTLEEALVCERAALHTLQQFPDTHKAAVLARVNYAYVYILVPARISFLACITQAWPLASRVVDRDGKERLVYDDLTTPLGCFCLYPMYPCVATWRSTPGVAVLDTWQRLCRSCNRTFAVASYRASG